MNAANPLDRHAASPLASLPTAMFPAPAGENVRLKMPPPGTVHRAAAMDINWT